VLHRFADLIARDAETLALLDTLQMGMPITNSVGAAAGAAHMVHQAAELADKAHDQLIPSTANALAQQVRRPHGVVAAITPWNYPVHVGLGRIAPALAAGNSVVLKPSEIAPLALLHLAALASEAGLPDGVLNALPGRGGTTGKLLALHHDVDCLAFTGSTATGLLLMQYAGQSNMKALQLECGGKSPQIVFDDGGDLDTLADILIMGFTHNSGQICSAGSRILVADTLYDRLVAALASRIKASTTGRALDPATALGPLANATQFQRVSEKLAAAGSGTTLIAQGRTTGGTAHEIAPHLYEARDPDAPLVQEEIFGPIAAVMRFRDAEEAVRLANSTRYGLSASVWCGDFALAHQVVRQLRAGFVSVNAVASPQPADEGPMSGEPFGMSGIGAYGGIAGMQAYTRIQAATFHLK
jgi:acyl-CoA reductase-like NAD-dependent aldehyde dehydrogenase